MALQALVKETVPGWQAEIEAGHFTAAADRLRKIQVQSHTGKRDLAGTVEWVGDLQNFLSERGGRDAPLKLFQDEQAISTLLERWNAVAQDYELLSLKIADWVPDFQNLRRRVLSQQRLLRNEQAIYLKAIAALEQSLRQQLTQATPMKHWHLWNASRCNIRGLSVWRRCARISPSSRHCNVPSRIKTWATYWIGARLLSPRPGSARPRLNGWRSSLPPRCWNTTKRRWPPEGRQCSAGHCPVETVVGNEVV